MNSADNTVVQDAPATETGGVKHKNTGFPEPLSQYRNTTLPHPSADTSPNASIESSDVSMARTHSRHSSFQLARLGTGKHRAKISGSLDGPTSPGGLSLPDDARAFFRDGHAPVDERGLSELSGSGCGDRQIDVPLGKETGNGNGNGTVQEWEHVKDEHEQERVEGARIKGVLKKLHLHH